MIILIYVLFECFVRRFIEKRFIVLSLCIFIQKGTLKLLKLVKNSNK